MNVEYLTIIVTLLPICFSVGLFFIIGAKKDLPILMYPKERSGFSSSFFTSTFWLSIRESFGEQGLRIYHYLVGIIFLILPVIILFLSINDDRQDANYKEQESLAVYQVDIGQRINGTWSEYPDSIGLRNSEDIIIQDYSWGKGYIKRNESLVIDITTEKPFLNPDFEGQYPDGIGYSLYITEVKGREDSIRVKIESTTKPGNFTEIIFHLSEPNIMQYQNVSSRRWGFRGGKRRQILYRNSGPDYYIHEE